MNNALPVGSIQAIKKSGQRFVDRPILVPPKAIASAIHLMIYGKPLTSILIGYERVRLEWQ